MTFARRENQFLQETFPVSLDHIALTATGTFPIFKARKACRVELIEYANPTGLAADNTNAFKLEVKNGSTVCGLVFNTDGDDVIAGASLAASAAFADAVTPGNEAARTLAAGDQLDAVFTEDGTATLPPGRLVLHLTYL